MANCSLHREHHALLFMVSWRESLVQCVTLCLSGSSDLWPQLHLQSAAWNVGDFWIWSFSEDEWRGDKTKVRVLLRSSCHDRLVSKETELFSFRCILMLFSLSAVGLIHAPYRGDYLSRHTYARLLNRCTSRKVKKEILWFQQQLLLYLLTNKHEAQWHHLKHRQVDLSQSAGWTRDWPVRPRDNV